MPKEIKQLDETACKILEILERDARISISELASRIGLSAPSTTERVRKLEQDGIITGFTVEINPKALGYILEAIVRVKPSPGNLHVVEQLILNEPRFTSCDKVTGEDCFVTRIYLKDVSELDDLLDPLHEKAMTNTSIVKASPIKNRMVPLR
ncbi:AsnC family regulatory protein [Pseudovibrio sp. FO-BEG1]|uniref:Transcriptional regulator, AsnC family n=1 Tax=Pseudovibrio denitrificans TaxID=258256 RepID=A0A1I7DXT6_9HYPH|nr:MULTISPECIES: Lrp/AsnC family transcriptional regulator [Pseudovibrio]AEV39491.1 AsnC family regulatory protein [Pseudovibrio sp. FO-BEG1]EEA92263.1 transcriptional regulator, AsnC family [Pseudovibrio sp. JE062]SFU16436.1 transcriptional regulator, AsnC family [Pseudovibrio denitrificans]